MERGRRVNGCRRKEGRLWKKKGKEVGKEGRKKG
jgi:hypothetical protein